MKTQMLTKTKPARRVSAAHGHVRATTFQRIVCAFLAVLIVIAESPPIIAQTPIVMTGIVNSNDTINLTWSGGSGTYALQQTTDLFNPDWTTFLATTATNVQFSALGGSTFFRMIDPKPNFMSLTLNTTNLTSSNILNLSLGCYSNGDWVLFSGGLDTNSGAYVTNYFNFSGSGFQGLAVRLDTPGQFSFVDSNGVPLGVGGTLISTPGPGTNDITYSGLLTNGTQAISFEAVSDPVPVIIIVVGVAAAACALIIKITDCSNSAAILNCIAACKEANGKPVVTVHTTFGLSYNPFRIGCSTDCSCDCQ